VEFLAFGLLGLGTIFILIGILSARDKSIAVPMKTEFSPVTQESFVTSTELRPAPAPVLPQQVMAQPITNKIHESKKMPDISKIPYKDINENALLFSQDSTLYIDKSGSNLYDSNKKSPSLINSSAIHRIGTGQITFNGFTFYFTNTKGKETINLNEIEKINFFPNAIAISKKNSSTTLIFFIDNTKHLKSLLDQHLTPHAAQ
jgi:hypothetical protein